MGDLSGCGFLAHVILSGDEHPESENRFLMWRIMEGLQDSHPHLWFGWYGIVPMVCFA